MTNSQARALHDAARSGKLWSTLRPWRPTPDMRLHREKDGTLVYRRQDGSGGAVVVR